MEGQVRLQKFLSHAGVTSRRKAEDLIKEGRVSVNGRVITEQGTKVTPGVSKVEIDGKPVRWLEERIYILLNKPRGYLTSLDDPSDRPLVVDLLPKGMPRVFPVGRLDWESEGLLLMSNDGDFAHALLHPSSEVKRTYLVKVKGEIPDDNNAVVRRLRGGVQLEDGFAKPDRVAVLNFTGKHTWLEFQLHIGRNQVVRRMCEAVGHPVLKLRRVEIGPLSLGTLPVGAYRDLTPEEVYDLYVAAGADPKQRPPQRSKGSGDKTKPVGRRVSKEKTTDKGRKDQIGDKPMPRKTADKPLRRR